MFVKLLLPICLLCLVTGQNSFFSSQNVLMYLLLQIAESRHTELSNCDQRGSYSPGLDFFSQTFFFHFGSVFSFSLWVLDLIRIGRTEQS